MRQRQPNGRYRKTLNEAKVKTCIYLRSATMEYLKAKSKEQHLSVSELIDIAILGRLSKPDPNQDVERMK